MKFNEIITEVFNSDVDGEIIRSTSSEFSVRATIGDRIIKFNAASGGSPDWEIDFHEQTVKGPTFGKTNSGNELQVFSFVIECIKLLVSKYQPNSISFTSEKADGGRTNLYLRIAKRLNLPGYTLELTDMKSSGFTVFTFTKEEE